jgi:hypothetical protein
MSEHFEPIDLITASVSAQNKWQLLDNSGVEYAFGVVGLGLGNWGVR